MCQETSFKYFFKRNLCVNPDDSKNKNWDSNMSLKNRNVHFYYRFHDAPFSYDRLIFSDDVT